MVAGSNPVVLGYFYCGYFRTIHFAIFESCERFYKISRFKIVYSIRELVCKIIKISFNGLPIRAYKFAELA